MAAENHQLRGLYAALGDLEDHASSAQLLNAYTVDPAPLYDARAPPVDRGRMQRAAAHLSSARAQADALARAEARLDAELVRRVFALATKVLRAGGDVENKRELAGAMRAFGSAVAALREQYMRPHGAGAAPLPKAVSPSVVDGLATRAEVDAGVAEAAELLERVREIAVRQARQIVDRLDAAEDRNRALFGVVDVPDPPLEVGDLEARVGALDASGAAVERADEIEAARSGFDDAMLSRTSGFGGMKEGVVRLKGKLQAAESAAGNLEDE